jgi:hypothetical protein
MIEREIKQNLLQVCKVKGWDSDFNVLAFHVLCDKLKELGAKKERERFYGQDKPAECSEGCPPNQICDYCQVVAPVKAMILAEREACADIAENWNSNGMPRTGVANEIRARRRTHEEA